MLGSTSTRVLSNFGFDVTGTTRQKERPLPYSGVKHVFLNVEDCLNGRSEVNFEDYDFVLNGIGLIKSLIHDDDPKSVIQATNVNTLFPIWLSEQATKGKFRLLQIGTDCVFSGSRGAYSENDEHDPLDVYGKTKSLGEASTKNVMILRCSIIGRETKTFTSLLEWFLKQSPNSIVKGYTNHLWNGITTISFAKIIRGIISTDSFMDGKFHVLPRNQVSKSELLHVFSDYFNRNDIQIVGKNTDKAVNRTLDTKFPEVNSLFWRNAGYSNLPTIQDLIKETANEY